MRGVLERADHETPKLFPPAVDPKDDTKYPAHISGDNAVCAAILGALLKEPAHVGEYVVAAATKELGLFAEWKLRGDNVWNEKAGQEQTKLVLKHFGGHFDAVELLGGTSEGDNKCGTSHGEDDDAGKHLYSKRVTTCEVPPPQHPCHMSESHKKWV